MKTKSVTSLFVIAILLSLVMVALNVLLFFVVKDESLEAAVARDSVALEKEAGSRAASMKAALASSEKDIAKLNSFLVDPENVVGFLDEFTVLGERTGVAVTVASVSEDKSEKPHLRITLTIEGGWKQVFLFFEFLRSMPYQLTFENITFDQYNAPDTQDSAGKTVKGGSAWRGNFTLTFAEKK